MLFKDFVYSNPKIKLEKGEEYEFVEMADISSGNKFVRSLINKEFKGGGSKFQNGDVLFARITPCLEHGKIVQFISNSSKPAFGSTEFFVFRNIEGISDKDFVYYLCLTDMIRKSAEKSMAGASGRQRAKIEAIWDVEINNTDIKEQQKISSILSNYDNLIENNENRIKLLEQIAKLIYEEWFVNYKFQGYESVKMIDSGTDFGEIPEDWVIDNLGNRFKVVLGGTPARAKPEYWGGNTKWINSGKVNELRIIDESEFITELGLKKSSTKLMPKRTTVLAITGATLGQVSLTETEVCANQSVVGIYDETSEHSEYLYLTIKKRIESIILKAGGGAQQHINKEIVEETEIVIPDKGTIKNFNLIIKPIFDLLANLLIKKSYLRKTRDLLLSKLISGEIDVSNLDIKIEKALEIAI